MTCVRSSRTATAIAWVVAAVPAGVLPIAGGAVARAQDVIVVEAGDAVREGPGDVGGRAVIVEAAPPAIAEGEEAEDGEQAAIVEAVVPADGGVVQVLDGMVVVHAPQVADPEEQRRQAIAQQIAQFEPAVLSELNSQLDLIRTLQGDIPPEARRSIVAAGETAAKEAARRTAEIMFEPQRIQGAQVRVNAGNIFAGAVRGLLGLGPRPVQPQPEPDRAERFDCIHHVAAALADSLEEHVGDAVARAFETEMTKRDERRRHEATRKIVSLLDDALVLSTEQAAAIEAALDAQWTDAMYAVTAYGNVVNNGRRLYPGLPRRAVVPHLSRSQRERFGGGEEDPTERLYGENVSRTWQVHRLQRAAGVERDPWWSP